MRPPKPSYTRYPCSACIILRIFNPQRACAARVAVIGSVCLCVGVSVCVSVMSHLTYGVSVHPENAVMYSSSNKDLPETTAFKSYTEQPIGKFFQLTHGQLSLLDI